LFCYIGDEIQEKITNSASKHEGNYFPAGTGAGIASRKQLLKKEFATIQVKKPDASISCRKLEGQAIIDFRLSI